jgi:hypothetical protein
MRMVERDSRRRIVLGICLTSLVLAAIAIAAKLFMGQNPPLWLWPQLVVSYVGTAAFFSSNK